MQKSKKLMTRGERVFQVVNNVIMAILCIICVYPLWYVLVCSISDPVLLYAQRGIMVWPLGEWSFHGYKLVIENPNIPIGFRNTLIYMGAGTLLNMFLTAGLGAASALFFIVTAVVLVCKVFSWQKNRTLDIQIKEG